MIGTISNFNLAKIIQDFGTRHFVETGTGRGEAINFAVMHTAFKTVLTCEIDMSLVTEARAKFVIDRRVRVFSDKSSDFLKMVCDVLPHDEPILFWLDAHFPGADYGIAKYADIKDTSIRLPLESELEIIHTRRPLAKDVVISDDLRIYVDGPFAHGNVPADVRSACPPDRDIEFMHRIMAATHDINLLYDHEGYVVMTPKITTHGD